MPRKTGSRKLVDIGGNGERLEKALVKFLRAHNIEFQKHYFYQGFIRYYVNVRDLSAAQSVLPALKQMAEGGPDVS